MLNSDFRDMLSVLNSEGVEYLLVGAYALAVHGLPRATGDIDIWIRPSDENIQRVWHALERFGAPLSSITQDDLKRPDIVFQIGAAPCRIDILTSIDGVLFGEAWPHRKEVDIEGLRVSAISRFHLIQNKRASGRPQDLADIAWLERQKEESSNNTPA